VLLIVAAIAASGCGHKAPKDPAPASSVSESANDGRFTDQKHKFAIAYTKPWTERKPTGPDDVVSLKRDDLKGEIAIAVPKLPAHIPGMIPLPSVEKGYIDDLKKRMKNVKETETQPVKIAGAFGRRFVIEGDESGGKKKLAVLAIVRGDTLYIMTAECPESEFEDVRGAFEQVARSWKWIE
jgi:hypothetical protein